MTVPLARLKDAIVAAFLLMMPALIGFMTTARGAGSAHARLAHLCIAGWLIRRVLTDQPSEYRPTGRVSSFIAALAGRPVPNSPVVPADRMRQSGG